MDTILIEYNGYRLILDPVRGYFFEREDAYAPGTWSTLESRMHGDTRYIRNKVHAMSAFRRLSGYESAEAHTI